MKASSPRYSVTKIHVLAFLPLLFLALSEGLLKFILLETPYSSILEGIRIFCGLLTLFFIPGIYMVVWVNRGKRILLSEYLVQAWALNLAFLILVPTVIKIMWGPISKWNFYMSCGLFSIAAFLWGYRREKTRYCFNDLAPFKVSFLILCLGLAGLCVIFRGYFTSPLDRFWIVKGNPITAHATGEIGDWKYPTVNIDDLRIAEEAEAGFTPRGKRRFQLKGTEGAVIYANPENRKIPFSLKFFVQSNQEGSLNILKNGVSVDNYTLEPVVMIRCEHLFQHPFRRVFSRRIFLNPGRNEIRFVFTPQIRESAPDTELIFDDFSNLNEQEFFQLAKSRFILTQVGPVYDILEVLDLGGHFKEKLFSYTDDLSPGRPGYFVQNQPLSFYFRSFALVLYGDKYQSVQYVYFGLCFLLFTALIMLYKVERRTAPVLITVLMVFAILAQTINLINFRFLRGDAAFFTVILLLAMYFLLRGETGWFTLFALFGIVTRNHGFILIFSMLLLLGLLFPDRRPMVRKSLFRFLMLCGGYLIFLLLVGAVSGDLRYWIYEFYRENIFIKFMLKGKYTGPGEGFIVFNRWILITSGFTVFLLFLKKDRISWFIFLTSLAFYLLICSIKFKKVYYLFLIVYPFVLVAARNLTQLGETRLAFHGPFNVYVDLGPLRRIFFIAFSILFLFCMFYLVAHPLVDPEFTSVFSVDPFHGK